MTTEREEVVREWTLRWNVGVPLNGPELLELADLLQRRDKLARAEARLAEHDLYCTVPKCIRMAQLQRDLLRERVKQLEAEKLERERKEGAK